MSQIRITLESKSYEFSNLQIPVEIRRPNLSLVTRSLSTDTFNLDPGDYLITAKLPAGQVFSNQIEVKPDEDTTTQVVLRPDPDDEAYQDDLEVQHYIWGSPTNAAPAEDDGLESLGPSSINVKMRVFNGNVLAGPVQPIAWPNWPSRNTNNPEASKEFETIDGVARFIQLLQPGLPAQNLTLPSSPQKPCRVVITRVNDRVSLDAHLPNDMGEMLVRYNQKGNFGHSNYLIPSYAETLLSQKMFDPIAAAVASYTLLRSRDLEQLHDWTANLLNRFRWLPDGIAIRSEHLAQLGNHKEALALIMTLPSRGLPIFSEGLAFLVDRLRSYANNGEKYFEPAELNAAKTLLEQLQRFALFTDFNQPFLTYTGIEPDKPGIEPVDYTLGAYDGLNVTF